MNWRKWNFHIQCTSDLLLHTNSSKFQLLCFLLKKKIKTLDLLFLTILWVDQVVLLLPWLASFWWLPSAWGSAGRPKMADGTSCQLGHFRSSRGSFSSVDSMIGFLTWESQGCPPAGKRKKSQGLLGSRYLNSLITSATSSQSHRPAHIQSSRKIDISRWVKQQRHVIKMLAFWK